MFAFQIGKYGIANGLDKDLHKTPNFYQGELHDMGRRQQYLIGQQMRQNYITRTGLLHDTYNPLEVFVRTLNTNRSIESANAQLLGLFNSHQMNENNQIQENQTSEAIPRIQIDDSVKTESEELGLSPLPNNYYPPVINAYDESNDEFFPYKVCPILQLEKQRRQQILNVSASMSVKYKDTINYLAQLLGEDTNKFTVGQAIQYADSLKARRSQQFDQSDLPPRFVYNMTRMYNEYQNLTLAMNSTASKAFLTQIFTEILSLFQSTIDLDTNGSLQRAERRIKFYMYQADDDMLLNFANAINYRLTDRLLNYSSTILIELHKIKIDTTTYYVNISVNGVEQFLPEACQNVKKCEYKNFITLSKSKTYYGDTEGYEKTCGLKPDETYNQQLNDWMNTFPQSIQYIEHKYTRILWMYLIQIVFGLALIYYLEKRKRETRSKKRKVAQFIEMINKHD
ncbi:histidine acid phosphatase family protein [Stylonychia lemnae]|uniref:Histidine acid phosphatase family protein n=1 Tax=Stylonychia lemnae TaxID=5949 RepID=A0A078AHG3_STYLE|nr:histidine acid phosphatase family protein [Stylonychia lemnae]|eukprot:CDW80278.1 histidine acid phosphatase family protein [Stylonychia lemnae]